MRCVNEQGFSLHAEVCCAAHQRKKLEHLCRYITRPAIANERLTLSQAGQVVLTLKTPYRDGTTHVVIVTDHAGRRRDPGTRCGGMPSFCLVAKDDTLPLTRACLMTFWLIAHRVGIADACA